MNHQEMPMTSSTAASPAAPTAWGPAQRFAAYALHCGAGIEGIGRIEREVDPLRANEVRVRIGAVALNHRDLMFADGRSGSGGRLTIPASDAAGTVIAIGPDVTSLAVGDRVVSSFFPDWLDGPATDAVTARALGGTLDGVLAEQVVLPETAWVSTPAQLSDVEAATLSCAGVTAWHALFGIEPLPAQSTVALLGTGGVSIWALQLAKAAGHRVAITSSDDAKLRRARTLGADVTLNYRTTPQWGSELRRLNGGHGVDRVLDVGGPETIAESITALRTGGSVVVIGRMSGNSPARINPADLFLGNKRLVGLMVGSRGMAAALARFVEKEALHPVIDKVFGFAQVHEAYRHLAAAQHFGKVVIDLDTDAGPRRKLRPS